MFGILQDNIPGFAKFGGSATSLLFGTQAGLSILTPAIGGLVADTWGLTSVFYFLAGTMLVANVLVFLLPPSEPRRPNAAPDRGGKRRLAAGGD